MDGVEQNDDGTFTVSFHGETLCTVNTKKEAQTVRLVAERAEMCDDLDFNPDEEDESEEEDLEDETDSADDDDAASRA